MISDATLSAAVGRGILSADQAQALRRFAAEAAPVLEEPRDEEKLRFITGFADIFVTLGLALFTGAIGYFASQAGFTVMWLALAASAWLLAEFFTRLRRMALPSIALLCLFAVSCFGAANRFIASAFLSAPVDDVLVFGTDLERPGLITAGALVTLLLTALHYARFRVPITIAAGTAAFALALLGLLFTLAPHFAEAWIKFIVLVLGLAVFALAMRYDLSDPRRETRRTDIAFWLHLLAAPLIVHPLASQIMSAEANAVAASLGMLATFLGLAIVAVAVDRRAVLVSGLVYAGTAFATLMRNTGFTDQVAPLTLLALGAFVLLLSAGWHPVRGAVLRLMPATLSRRLPQPI